MICKSGSSGRMKMILVSKFGFYCVTCSQLILLAIWDNRSVFHSATFDYEELGERFGNRAVGIGEAPYFDANSKSRTEALTEKREIVKDHGTKERV